MPQEITLISIPVELQAAIVELLSRNDALRLALTCRWLRDVALRIINREISISTTSSGFDYNLKLLRKRNIRKRVRTLNLRLDAPEADSQLSSRLITWIFGELQFRCLETFRIATSFVYLKVWRDMFAFLHRHPGLKAVSFDFRRCEEYQTYDHVEDANGLWAPITPDLLPSLRALTVDATLLAMLARQNVAALARLTSLHIVDHCVGDQEAIWEIMYDKKHLFETLPRLHFTYLPSEEPAAFGEIYEYLAHTFTGVRHLFTNFGEGLWTAETIDDLLHELTIIWTLSIPVRVAQDFLADHSAEAEEQDASDADQAPPAPLVLVPYSDDADLAFRMTPEVQNLTAELTRVLQMKSPVQDIILHMPGWSPESSLVQ